MYVNEKSLHALGVLLPEQAGQSERGHPEPPGHLHGVGREGDGWRDGHGSSVPDI